MSDFLHIDQNGGKWELTNMTTRHLKNVLALLRRRASEGVKIEFGCHDFGNNPYYDIDYLYGNDALKHLNYQKYENELIRRRKL